MFPVYFINVDFNVVQVERSIFEIVQGEFFREEFVQGSVKRIFDERPDGIEIGNFINDGVVQVLEHRCIYIINNSSSRYKRLFINTYYNYLLINTFFGAYFRNVRAGYHYSLCLSCNNFMIIHNNNNKICFLQALPTNSAKNSFLISKTGILMQK